MMSNNDDDDGILQDVDRGLVDSYDDNEITGDAVFCGGEDDLNKNSGETMMYTSRRITLEEYDREGARSREIFEKQFKKLIPLIEPIRRTKAYQEMAQSARASWSSSSSTLSMTHRNDRRYHSSSHVGFSDSDSDDDNEFSDSETVSLFSSHRRDAGGRSKNVSRRNSARRNSFNRHSAGGKPWDRGGISYFDSLICIIFISLSLFYLFYTYVWVGNLSCYNAKDNFELIELKCYDKVLQSFESGESALTERDEKLSNTYLHKAAEVGGTSFGEVLIKKRHDLIDMQNYAGETALHIAVRNDHLEFVKLLISNGANCSISNKDGRSPIDYSKNREIDQVMPKNCKAPPVENFMPPPPQGDPIFLQDEQN